MIVLRPSRCFRWVLHCRRRSSLEVAAGSRPSERSAVRPSSSASMTSSGEAPVDASARIADSARALPANPRRAVGGAPPVQPRRLEPDRAATARTHSSEPPPSWQRAGDPAAP
jgi:hypothetical protein